MSFLISVVGFVIAIILMNLLACVLQSPMRFGWYEKGKG